MPYANNQYYDPGAPYLAAGQQLAETLFGNREKAGAYQKQNLENQLLQEQINQQRLLNIQGGKKPQPVMIPPKSRKQMQDLADELLTAQMGQKTTIKDLPGIPAAMPFQAGAAAEQKYQDTRNQYEAAQALIDALGIPAGSAMGSYDKTPGPSFDTNFPFVHPSNFGGNTPAIITPEGKPFDWGGLAPAAVPSGYQPPAAPVVPPAAVAPVAAPAPTNGIPQLSPAQAAAAPSGTRFIGMDGIPRTKR